MQSVILLQFRSGSNLASSFFVLDHILVSVITMLGVSLPGHPGSGARTMTHAVKNLIAASSSYAIECGRAGWSVPAATAFSSKIEAEPERIHFPVSKNKPQSFWLLGINKSTA